MKKNKDAVDVGERLKEHCHNYWANQEDKQLTKEKWNSETKDHLF